MVCSVVSNDDLALWCCLWLLQVQIAFIFEENLGGGGNLVASLRDGKNSTL